MSTLVLCESASDIEAARGLPDATAVALAPAAWMEADRRGTPCPILEDFYSERALADLRRPVLETQLAWMDRLDGALAGAVPLIAANQLRMSRLWFYCLKRLIDPLNVMAFAAGSALDALNPGRLAVPASPAPAHDWAAFFRVGPHGRMDVPHYAIGDVAARAAESRGIPVTRLAPSGGGAEAVSAPVRRGGARGLFRRHAPPWLLDASALVRKFGIGGVRHLLPSGDKGARLLVVRGGYDLDLVVDRVSDEFAIDYWSRVEKQTALAHGDAAAVDGARAACAALWTQIETEPWLREPFVRSRVDTYALAGDGLRYFVTETVPASLGYYLRARAWMRARAYAAVLAPAAMRATSLLAAARAEGVPVFIYQHGGFVGTCEHLIWDFCDFSHADMLVVYGDGERAYFERRRALYREPRARVRAAGSARLEQQLARDSGAAAVRAGIGAPEGSRIVLYAATMTSGYSRMIAAESYPETRCFLNQVRALEIMKQHPGVTFVFKPYSDRDDRAIREMAARRGVANCRVIANVPLLRLMQAADAVLVEFPSTALLEAAATDKPLAVYIDRDSLRLDDEARAALAGRATIAETMEEFEAAMHALARGGPPQDGGGSAYTRLYALDRGISALDTAAGILRETAAAARTP